MFRKMPFNILGQMLYIAIVIDVLSKIAFQEKAIQFGGIVISIKFNIQFYAAARKVLANNCSY
jgi:hypothetical protein